MQEDAIGALRLWLRRLKLRSRLTAADQAAVLALPGKMARLRANADFVHLKQQLHAACLVVDGMAARFGQTRDGARQLTAIHLPGDMADLHSAMLPHSASAWSALSDVVIYRVPHPAIHAAARASHSLKDALWRDCVADAAMACEWLVNTGRRDALARVAHLLCELSVRNADIGEAPERFALRMTQAQLADATGLTPVHVNRMLKQLREMGIAAIDQRIVHIYRPVQLRHLADFDEAYLHRQPEIVDGEF